MYLACCHAVVRLCRRLRLISDTSSSGRITITRYYYPHRLLWVQINLNILNVFERTDDHACASVVFWSLCRRIIDAHNTTPDLSILAAATLDKKESGRMIEVIKIVTPTISPSFVNMIFSIDKFFSDAAKTWSQYCENSLLYDLHLWTVGRRFLAKYTTCILYPDILYKFY